MTIWPTSLAAAVLSGLMGVPTQAAVWTAVIPQGFPGDIYTWQLMSDGRYSEDGRNASTGAANQPTLSGHWRRTGTHMVLKQDGIDFVFEGDILGDEYLGVLYLDGKRFSRFCAARGTKPPPTCNPVSA